MPFPLKFQPLNLNNFQKFDLLNTFLVFLTIILTIFFGGMMLSETRLAKIHEMEQILNEANSLMNKMEQLQQSWIVLLPKIRELENYYAEQWQEDYNADERGEIPSEMIRGVLSEDAVYNLFIAHREIALEWIRLSVKSMETT